MKHEEEKTRRKEVTFSVSLCCSALTLNLYLCISSSFSTHSFLYWLFSSFTPLIRYHLCNDWIPSIKPITAHLAFTTALIIDPHPTALWGQLSHLLPLDWAYKFLLAFRNYSSKNIFQLSATVYSLWTTEEFAHVTWVRSFFLTLSSLSHNRFPALAPFLPIYSFYVLCQFSHLFQQPSEDICVIAASVFWSTLRSEKTQNLPFNINHINESLWNPFLY